MKKNNNKFIYLYNQFISLKINKFAIKALYLFVLISLNLGLFGCSTRTDFAKVERKEGLYYQRGGTVAVAEIMAKNKAAKRYNQPGQSGSAQREGYVQEDDANYQPPIERDQEAETLLYKNKRRQEQKNNVELENSDDNNEKFSRNSQYPNVAANINSENVDKREGEVDNLAQKPSASLLEPNSGNELIYSPKNLDSNLSKQLEEKDYNPNYNAKSHGFIHKTPLNSPKFIWPLQGELKRHMSNQHPGFAEGITISAPLHTPVFAARSGQVVYSHSNHPKYGGLVIIQHESGYLTAYAHLNKVLVKKGETVLQTQKIGTTGRSGQVVDKSPQLFFSMRKDKKIVDPEKILDNK